MAMQLPPLLRHRILAEASSIGRGMADSDLMFYGECMHRQCGSLYLPCKRTAGPATAFGQQYISADASSLRPAFCA